MVAERQVYKLRQILFKQILRQDIGWYDKNDNGNLALKLSDDLERIKEGIGVKMSLVIQCLSLFFSGIATGLMTNWRLTCIILLIGPIMMGMNAYVIKFNANAAAREQKQYGIAGNIANEVLMNIRTVIAFCKEAAEMKRYKKALEAGAKITRSSDLILSYAMGFVYFLICICFGIGFYFGALFMNEGLCTPGSVFTVFFCVISGAFSAGNALPFIHAIAVASGCATSIFDIINRVPDVDPYSKSGLKPVSVNGAIEIKNVSFKYPTRPEVEVLHNLSVTIEQGKIIAFVGSSGAGKSTSIGLLLRFYDPSEGMITLDGIPLQQLNLRWLRNQIGVVAQEPILFSSSIAENIRYGRVDVSQKEIEKAAHLANAHSFISKLPEGYNTLAGIRGSQLSGGQKQRIAIARALVRNPKILLLDEATSALDGHSEEVVQQALEKAMQNRTTIIIAHRMSTVRNADIIYVMKNGYIAENGKHEDLMARKDLYYNFVMAQTLVKNIDEGRNLDSEKKCEVQDIPQVRLLRLNFILITRILRCSIEKSYVLSNASTKLIVRLRSKAFNNIIKQSVSWFDLPFSSPNLLITRLARDAPLVKMIIHGQIEFKNVNFTYPVRTEVNVLKELDFNLEIGKTLAIVGESGSELIYVLFDKKYFQKVDNYNIAELNTCYLRRNIGLVTQEPCLFDRTIKENISYGLLTEEDESVIMQKVIVAAKSVNIHNFIVSLPLGYETMVGEGGTNLSGGQKQRIAIARALVKDPKILLLDEATSALDTENEKIVQEALDIARTNRTCITIAHRLSTIQNADKIAVMSKGKIVESGTHTELINKQNYYYRLTRKQDI
ncbi:hypothetical protein PGB90_009636 [Kerria lacca]